MNLFDTLTCPICGWESKGRCNGQKLSIHVRVGHSSEEINRAVDSGILCEKRSFFSAPSAAARRLSSTSIYRANDCQEALDVFHGDEEKTRNFIENCSRLNLALTDTIHMVEVLTAIQRAGPSTEELVAALQRATIGLFSR